MDLVAISSALASLKTVSDIINNSLNVSKDTAVREKAMELQNVIISLQANLLQIQMDFSNTLKDKEQLEKELAQNADWEETKKMYKLSNIYENNHSFAYASQNKNEPFHYICANCFSSKNKSILQAQFEGSFHCPRCNATI